MNDRIKKYQDILIDLTLNNKTIYLDKIDENEFLDLYNLRKIDESTYSGLKDFIISNKCDKIKIVEDPLKWQSSKIFKIKESVRLHKDKKNIELGELFEGLELQDRREHLEHFCNSNLNKNLEILNKQYLNMVNITNNLEKLCYGSEQDENFYIGYPFIEGYICNNEYIRCPIFLIPVNIVSEQNEWYLEKRLDKRIQVNKYLITMLERVFDGLRINVKTEYTFEEDFNNEIIYSLIEAIKNYDVSIKLKDSLLTSPIEQFSNILNKFESNNRYFKINNFMLLGKFKVIGDGFFDYETLKSIDLDKSIVSTFLGEGSEQSESSSKARYYNYDLYVRDVLDYSHQMAIRFVENNKVSIINTPVDSHKNKMIFNLILDKISKGAKVLFISKNRDDLDDVYSKFSDMSSLAVKIFDEHKDLNYFYEKLNSSLTLLKDFKKNPSIFEEFEIMLSDMESKYQFIEDANGVYYSKSKFGLTLQKMYELTLGAKESYLNDDSFKSFVENNPVAGCNFEEISKYVNNIKNNNLIQMFINYKEYLNKHKVVSCINEDICKEKVLFFREAIEDLKSKYTTISLSLNKNDESLKVLELYKDKTLTKDDIVNSLLEYKYNDIFIEESGSKKSEKWWGNFIQSKNKKIDEDEIIKLNERQEFKNQIIDVYDNIHNLFSNIDFLGELLKTDNFKLVKDKVFSLEDITDFVDGLYKCLESYEEFLNYRNAIKCLEDIERDILRYIYNNSINISMMNENLNSIVKFSIIINIIRLNEKYGDKLDKYKKIDRTFKSLNNIFEKRSNMVTEVVLNFNRENAFKKIYEHDMEGLLKEQLDLKENIKLLLEDFKDECLSLIPCFIVNLSQVSSTIPLIEGMFDYVIIDNCEEHNLAEVIPYMYRGNKVVILGDENQINFDKNVYNLIGSQDSIIVENLLSFSKDKYESVYLRYSYDLDLYNLNQFSDLVFNNSDTIKIPNKIRLSGELSPFSLFKIDTQLFNNSNVNEAEFVVNLFYDILKNKKDYETVAIVTLTKDHRDIIKNIINDRLKLDDEFSFLYHVNNGDYSFGGKSIYIRCLDELVYDKRDIIIFSLGCGFTVDGSIQYNFDSLEGSVGKNKLNTFTKLSQKKMHIVTSIDIDEIATDDTKNSNLKLFKGYLKYASLVSEGNIEDAQGFLDDIKVSREMVISNELIVNKVKESLENKGLIVDKYFGNLDYKFDLCLYDSSLGKYILAVNLDGTYVKKFTNSRERDVDFQIYLEKFEWKVLKIWSVDLWNDFESQILYILNEYDKERKKIIDDIDKCVTENLDIREDFENCDNKIEVCHDKGMSINLESDEVSIDDDTLSDKKHFIEINEHVVIEKSDNKLSIDSVKEIESKLELDYKQEKFPLRKLNKRLKGKQQKVDSNGTFKEYVVVQVLDNNKFITIVDEGQKEAILNYINKLDKFRKSQKAKY